ncbi:thiamine phosphate synthase [Pelagicoccus sp. SDUM812003]|uniref:thiamine phosphate synthase n=1 Tax=Pelagicoccus sp. SDUM812003 TaxID=3041267 RepID=UPI00280DFF92|nr:thiamine phosphate synthase [Pelagicoccus sp. SDUM812003]MDQ8204785.1 thiamine phosphate synthase [Pelagicoccus sp. SDUM812003]
MLPLNSIRYYGILDTGYVSASDWLAKYDALERGGAGIIQIRAKTESTQQRAELVKRVVEHRSKKAAPIDQQPHLIVNDDLDLCLAHPGLGLHVGQDDLPAATARERLGPDRLLGLSTHSFEQAKAAMDLGPSTLSYFAVGPVFPTQTKPTYQAVGLQLVAEVAAEAPELPFFCIGGINRQNIPQVIAAGAKRVVTVSDTLCDEDTAQAVAKSIQLLGQA